MTMRGRQRKSFLKRYELLAYWRWQVNMKMQIKECDLLSVLAMSDIVSLALHQACSVCHEASRPNVQVRLSPSTNGGKGSPDLGLTLEGKDLPASSLGRINPGKKSSIIICNQLIIQKDISDLLCQAPLMQDKPTTHRQQYQITFPYTHLSALQCTCTVLILFDNSRLALRVGCLSQPTHSKIYRRVQVATGSETLQLSNKILLQAVQKLQALNLLTLEQITDSGALLVVKVTGSKVLWTVVSNRLLQYGRMQRSCGQIRLTRTFLPTGCA